MSEDARETSLPATSRDQILQIAGSALKAEVILEILNRNGALPALDDGEIREVFSTMHTRMNALFPEYEGKLDMEIERRRRR